jgi:GNAT superfamily N-acetyltransferase
VSWHRASSPEAFAERCRDFLMAGEAEHNLLLGLLPGLVSGNHPYHDPIYLAWWESGSSVLGYAFRTPPFKVSCSALPPEAIAPLADDLARVYETIPAVMGPEDAASALADAWVARRGGTPHPGMRLRIHALEAVRDDLPSVPGAMRSANESDLDRTARWLEAFGSDTGIADTEPQARARSIIEGGGLRIWDHGGARSMAAWAGTTETSTRVGYVYTPDGYRGRGYATALVAELSREVLATGRRSAFLYTDLANPTSNAIYARIGYEPVADVVDVEIRTAS